MTLIKSKTKTCRCCGQSMTGFGRVCLQCRIQKAKSRSLKNALAAKAKPRTAKPARRIRPVSKAKAKDVRAYRAAARRFVLERPVCAVCGQKGVTMEVHHTRGRLGSLLMDERFWLTVHADCHMAIHARPAWARSTPAYGARLYLLCAEGEWNTAPKAEA